MKIYEYILKFKDQGSDKLKRIARASGQAETKVNRLSSAFGGLKTAVAGLAIGAALTAGAMAAGRLGIEMEQTRISFTTFLKSADKANDSIAQLNEFSNVTPFDNAQVIRAGKGLLAFGVAQDKVIPSLKKIGDISAATGKDFNELATIYGKARIAGTLYAEDINQLVEAGVPVMGEFAKALGTTEDKVKKMASEGKLKFKDLEQAFTNLTSEGGLFFDLMSKQSESAGGKISTFQGKMQLLGVGIGEAFNPVIKQVFGKLITVVDENKDRIIAWAQAGAQHTIKFFQTVMPYVKGFISGVQGMVQWMREHQTTMEILGYTVGIVASAFVGYHAALFAMALPSKVLALWTGILTAKQWLLNIALNANPIGLVVGAIAALVAITTIIIKKYDEWGAALSLFLGPLGMVINMVQSFRRHWDSIKQAFETDGITGALKRIGLVLLDAILMPLQQLLHIASKLPGKLGDMAKVGALGIEALRKKLDLLPENVEVKTKLVGDKKSPLDVALSPKNLTDNGGQEAVQESLKSGVDTINGGGTKHTNITVNVETLKAADQISVSSAEEGVFDIEEQLKTVLLRVLNSANQVAIQ